MPKQLLNISENTMERATRHRYTRNNQPTQTDTDTLCTAQEPPRDRQDRGNFLDEWIRNARDRRRERLERREEQRRPKETADTKLTAKKPEESAVLKKHNGIDEMKLPKGFSQRPDKDVSTNFYEKRSEYEAKNSPGTRIAVSKEEGWLPSKEAQDALKKILAKAPHALTEEETDAISEVFPKPPFGTRGPFTVTGLSTKKVGNENVLVMEISNDNTDRRAYGYFFNASYVKPNGANQEAGSIESVWFEANTKDYKKYQKDALDSLHQIKFR
jgi:hypothetical protein